MDYIRARFWGEKHFRCDDNIDVKINDIYDNVEPLCVHCMLIKDNDGGYIFTARTQTYEELLHVMGEFPHGYAMFNGEESFFDRLKNAILSKLLCSKRW